MSESPLITQNQCLQQPNDDMWKIDIKCQSLNDDQQIANQQIFSTESLVLYKSPIPLASQGKCTSDFNPETSDEKLFILIEDQTQSQKELNQHLDFQTRIVENSSSSQSKGDLQSFKSARSIVTKGSHGKERYQSVRSSQSIVRDSLENLRLQTLTTYSELKENQASLKDIRKVQEVFKTLSHESPKKLSKNSSHSSRHNHRENPVRQSFIPPPPQPINKLLTSMAQFFTQQQKPEKQDNNYIKLPISLQPSLGNQHSVFSIITNQTIVKDQDKLIDSIKKKINDHFQRKPQTVKAATKIEDKQQLKIIDNLFEYQRSILIQTALMKYQFNSPHFLSMIENGKIENILTEQLETFVKILPRQNELQKLKETILSEGYINYEEAQGKTKLGTVESFFILIQSYPKLQLKAEILLDIALFQDKINDLMMLNENWTKVFDFIIKNENLRSIVYLIQQSLIQLQYGDTQFSKQMYQFNILEINRVFEVKSTKNAQKTMYDVLFKDLFLLSEDRQWLIFSEPQISMIRVVMRDNISQFYLKINELTNIHQKVQTEFNQWDLNDKVFRSTLESFQKFYQEHVKIVVQQTSKQFDIAVQNFLEYFGQEDISNLDQIIQTIFEFSIKHQKVYEKILIKIRNQQRQSNMIKEERSTPSKQPHHSRTASDVNQHLISAPKKISHQRVKSNLLGEKQSPIVQQAKQKQCPHSIRTKNVSPRDSHIPKLQEIDEFSQSNNSNAPKTQKKQALNKQLFNAASKSCLKSPAKAEPSPSQSSRKGPEEEKVALNTAFGENALPNQINIGINFAMNELSSRNKAIVLKDQGKLRSACTAGQNQSFLTAVHKKGISKENDKALSQFQTGTSNGGASGPAQYINSGKQSKIMGRGNSNAILNLKQQDPQQQQRVKSRLEQISKQARF
ncbi:UNKNOWN [Stylonychia lemnae]|uniref:FH2 domain-containing protein n=1 Tax=Stylonychia lemnae TaxID=5949 RepID=A0A078AD79_STYLE|nr:UNKNOWN [Stylonychia lemnae]|eukprot:CDW80195.1 UNKNOWN [Stylonychia lemnae]